MFKDKFEKLGGLIPLGSDDFEGLSTREIDGVEEAAGISLPEDYRHFLATYGRSAFQNSIGFKPLNQKAVYEMNDETGLPNPEFTGSQVSDFFGGHDDPDYRLLNYIEMYSDRTPESVIPIADDGLGNKICLAGGDHNFGFVYWWDHGNEWDEEDYEEETGKEMQDKAKYQNMYLLAESFTDFIDRLFVVAD